MQHQDRYSPRLWPRQALPVPRLSRPAAVSVSSDGWIVPAEGPSEFVECPPEVHLREFGDVDVGDLVSLVRLVELVGLPLEPTQPARGLVSPEMVPRLADQHYELQVSHLADQFAQPAPDLSRRPDLRSAHVLEVALRVWWVRQLVRHVDAVLTASSVAAVWQSAGFLDLDGATTLGPDSDAWDGASAEDVGWNLFAGYLNDALSTISPRILPPRAVAPAVDVRDAFTAACVLIWNDLADEVPYRHCADETCGRLFRFQIGRSTGTHRRGDVQFCSPAHARNQSQRERRRRDRARRMTNERQEG